MKNNNDSFDNFIPEGAEEGPLILFAEDDLIIKKLTSHILLNSGYRLITVSEGTKAVEVFNNYKDQIKLLILDGIMPLMNGIEAYRNISVLKKPPPVLFSSGFPEGIKKSIHIDEKNTFLIRKPYKTEEFLDVVKKILKNSSDGIKN